MIKAEKCLQKLEQRLLQEGEIMRHLNRLPIDAITKDYYKDSYDPMEDYYLPDKIYYGKKKNRDQNPETPAYSSIYIYFQPERIITMEGENGEETTGIQHAEVLFMLEENEELNLLDESSLAVKIHEQSPAFAAAASCRQTIVALANYYWLRKMIEWYRDVTPDQTSEINISSRLVAGLKRICMYYDRLDSKAMQKAALERTAREKAAKFRSSRE
ncbi:hypothetical protein P280DRAFT_470879 [Massarina eburnea CBS 473.64]|uniref:Uncharacterized protein n=1 Tax=Massarina eburnea CBS 473.64 TaxID=1395130 RepID=A0A6A6RU61_9PLEO|nr:hypothetical protein P280DRAFT_470879 [Massarina eburnea CBS 473.64]